MFSYFYSYTVDGGFAAKKWFCSLGLKSEVAGCWMLFAMKSFSPFHNSLSALTCGHEFPIPGAGVYSILL
jgi:hypothetical protein